MSKQKQTDLRLGRRPFVGVLRADGVRPLPWLSIHVISKMAVEVPTFKIKVGLDSMVQFEQYLQVSLFHCRYQRWKYLSAQLNLGRSRKHPILTGLVKSRNVVGNPRQAIQDCRRFIQQKVHLVRQHFTVQQTSQNSWRVSKVFTWLRLAINRFCNVVT